MSYICRQIRHTSTLRRASTRKSVPAPVKLDLRYPLPTSLDLRNQHSFRKCESSGANVVNEELCDQALSLLEPSLERYKGCNIIDFFPGPGVWSRKIHELLQPRAHILVEDPKDTYESFLQPLLHQPGSRFRYRSLKEPTFYGTQFYDEVLADLDQPALGAPQNAEPNNDILVLATLTKLPKVTSNLQHKIDNSDDIVAKDISPAGPFVLDFLRHLHFRTGPHSSGPARLLFWTLDRDKFNFLPRTVLGRSNTPLEAEEACFLREIVGSAEPTKARRPAYLELHSAIETAKRMNVSSLSLPTVRQSWIHRNVLKHTKMSYHEALPTDLTKELSELNDMEIKWAFDAFKRSRRSTKIRDKRRKELTEEYARMTELRASLENLAGEARGPDTKRITDTMLKALTFQILLNRLERETASGKSETLSIKEPTSTSESPVLSKYGTYDMKHINDRVADLSNRMGDSALTTMLRVSDDHEALFSKPPLLCWDRRPFEPLESSPGDFYPQRKLALLDFQPRDLGAEKLVSRMPLVRCMRSMRQMPIHTVLDRVANGAGEALLPNCPTINDPIQGGRLNLENLRVRMLTHDMWRELVRAWNRWPFRKSDEQLNTEFGTSSQDIEWHTEDPSL